MSENRFVVSGYLHQLKENAFTRRDGKEGSLWTFSIKWEDARDPNNKQHEWFNCVTYNRDVAAMLESAGVVEVSGPWRSRVAEREGRTYINWSIRIYGTDNIKVILTTDELQAAKDAKAQQRKSSEKPVKPAMVKAVAEDAPF